MKTCSLHVSVTRKILIGVLLLEFLGRAHSYAGEFVNGALSYVPPAVLYAVELNLDPGDNPFSGDGPGIEFLSQTDADRDFGSVRFQFGLIGFAVGNGKRVTYSTVTTNEMRRIFEKLWTKSDGATGTVRMTSIDGLPAVTARSTGKAQQTRLHETTWVQVKTNAVLKINVVAQNQPMFDALVASLKTVKVDPNKFLESLRPKQPKITQLQATTIEMGFAPLHGRSQVPVFVFHTRDGAWSIVSAEHFDQGTENELFKSLVQVLERLSNKSTVPGARCRATIDISRYGRGPDEVQRTAAFHEVEQLHPLRGVSTQKLEGLQPFGLSSISDKGAPNGFRKVRELTFKMELVIENHENE
jgi:hypothetical protein